MPTKTTYEKLKRQNIARTKRLGYMGVSIITMKKDLPPTRKLRFLRLSPTDKRDCKFLWQGPAKSNENPQ